MFAMKAVRNVSFAFVTMLGLSLCAGTASAGNFTEFVKGHVRQQLNTPQQTPITKTIKVTKKAATTVANKAYGAIYDHAVKAGKKN